VIHTNPNWEPSHGNNGRQKRGSQVRMNQYGTGRRHGSLEEAETQEEHKLKSLLTVIRMVERLDQSHLDSLNYISFHNRL
jgi:hypothetical protein